MPWMKWLPWRYLIRRAARARGFLDPVAVLSRLHRFAQPSEVAEPVELLRAGVVFHARGLINSRVIQHNLDWVWPFWIERQFDPADDAFVPRAFSITHVNLTHRNWTAIGLPDHDELPLVDPRGLLTPFLDGWSLDAALVTRDGGRLLPSRAKTAEQRMAGEGAGVFTRVGEGGLEIESRATVVSDGGALACEWRLAARADREGWLVVALRPVNPEGISFVHQAALDEDRKGWTVDGERRVLFSEAADRHHVSNYRHGDVFLHLFDLEDSMEGRCDVGMVTAAAMFPLAGGEAREIVVRVPLSENAATPGWQKSLEGCCRLEVPDETYQTLFDTAVKTLILHSPEDVYPGPYTYKRFWFRDAAFIIHGLLASGLIERAERALDRFPGYQDANGYFHSQEGEWDSNGEALWIFHRFCEITGRPPKEAWRRAIVQGGRWIGRKRVKGEDGSAHAGLLPAGFSAEHLGPNDYYYWDDFWGVAGLRAAASLALQFDAEASAGFKREAEDFAQALEKSLDRSAARLGRPAMPASPYRRLDAGAIGSLAGGYPLMQLAAGDPRLHGTVEFLLGNCFVGGGFFQDMIHSGINPYLTLHVAQVLLRAGDPRHVELMDAVAALASPTGQWPEAIHPRTRGGCMGDGQHVWAAAEWVLMLRNCFLREEAGGLILCSGIPARWLVPGRRLFFGPAPTAFGTVSVEVRVDASRVQVAYEADWHAEAPTVSIQLPGKPRRATAPGEQRVEWPLGASA